MNKQEIQTKIEQAKADKQAINENLQRLEKELREAEKPKLWYGDFGIVWDEDETHPSRFFISRHENKLWWSRYCGLPSLTPLHYLTEYKYLIFGNIFDLLKDEDFKEFLKKKEQMSFSVGHGCPAEALER